MTYILLLLGFFALIKGGDLFVDGSSNIAKAMRIPPVIIGLTIVALGTSLPEASVSITAALSGSNELALSNVTGSNIFNLMVVVGVCALIMPVAVDKDILKRDFPVAIFASVLVLAFVLDNTISRLEGIIFVVICVLYILFLVKTSLKNRSENEDPISGIAPVWQSIFLIVVGIGAIILGGDLVVNSSVTIAESFGLSETLIGLTIVSIGTSLPELVTSVVAAKKKESDLALGNALGSCILNILFILGLSSVISPINLTESPIVHVWVMIGTAILMFVFATTSKNVSKKEGLVSVLVYVVYMAYLIIEQGL